MHIVEHLVTLKKEDVTPPYLSHFRYHHKLFILPLQCLWSPKIRKSPFL